MHDWLSLSKSVRVIHQSDRTKEHMTKSTEIENIVDRIQHTVTKPGTITDHPPFGTEHWILSAAHKTAGRERPTLVFWIMMNKRRRLTLF